VCLCARAHSRPHPLPPSPHSTCLPWLAQLLRDLSSSADVELAGAAQRALEK